MNTGERCVWGESSVCRHVCYQFISCMGEMCVCEMSVYVCVLGGRTVCAGVFIISL